MKKAALATLSAALLTLGAQNALATTHNEVELGLGFFYVGSQTPVSINLDKLDPTHTYDIICTVKALDANNFPVKLGFYIQEDTSGTTAWEKTFNDEHHRAIFFPHLNIQKPSSTKLAIKVLEGKGTANPVEYHCYAEDRI